MFSMRSPDPLARTAERRRRWTPAPMQRIALVAPGDRLRDALVRLADFGVVELDQPAAGDSAKPVDAEQRLQRLGFHVGSSEGSGTVLLSETSPDLAALERDGRADLLAGEAQLQRYAAGAVHRREIAAIAGWCPAEQLPG